ncbi:hypothetical protein M409DRAFT_56782 [Zasmidium cellare ATCC 36951]|uniref:Uncharacterized protein n=1 Tax=Zasmidium cellare ATCC 36951 TaxID=1080233 RepID=A0A6A6CEH7_ZASCE|nr:uncharacterized protein M409DRAFT_56782 [Zasmidium cellare ATCC 36951]KAF2164059.1 hypothetical protein M409DRAFT_56782 [Zasmidium cellare ATCC 36951]
MWGQRQLDNLQSPCSLLAIKNNTKIRKSIKLAFISAGAEFLIDSYSQQHLPSISPSHQLASDTPSGPFVHPTTPLYISLRLAQSALEGVRRIDLESSHHVASRRHRCSRPDLSFLLPKGPYGKKWFFLLDNVQWNNNTAAIILCCLSNVNFQPLFRNLWPNQERIDQVDEDKES